MATLRGVVAGGGGGGGATGPTFAINAISDQSNLNNVIFGVTVTASSGTLVYSWEVNGDTANLDDATIAAPTFSPPQNGTYTVSCAITDDNGTTQAAPVTFSASGPEDFNYLDLTTGVKSDPNALEVSTPSSQPDKWYRFTFDASTAYTATTDTLLYSFTLPDIAWGESFSLLVSIEMQNESAQDLWIGCGPSTAQVATGASGLWTQLRFENQPGDKNYDYASRLWSEPLLGTASVLVGQIAAHTWFRHFATRIDSNSTLVDASTNPSTWKVNISQDQDFTVAASGAVYLNLMMASQVIRTASESLDIRIGYKLISA